MRLTVSCIPEDGINESLKLPVTLDDITLEKSVQLFLTAHRLGDTVLVSGQASSMASLSCSRCLRNFSLSLKVGFKAEYIRHGEFTGEGEHELTREELDVSFYRDDEIDIGDLVREQMLLAVPIKPLCESGCKGLCPRCGRSLNESSCQCRAGETDSRLSLLKKLK